MTFTLTSPTALVTSVLLFVASSKVPAPIRDSFSLIPLEVAPLKSVTLMTNSGKRLSSALYVALELVKEISINLAVVISTRDKPLF